MVAWCDWQAGTQDVNFLYSLAWIDLTGGPLVVSAPDTGGRFYELQFVDVYNQIPLLIGGVRHAPASDDQNLHEVKAYQCLPDPGIMAALHKPVLVVKLCVERSALLCLTI